MRRDRARLHSTPSPPKRVPAMGATAADGAFAADRRLRFKEDGVEVGKILEFQSRNLLADEVFNGLQCADLFSVHQGKCVTDILGTTGPADAMDIIFRMFRHVVVDNVT